MMEERTDVKSLFFQELDQQLREKGLKAFRSGQIFQYGGSGLWRSMTW